MIPKRKYLSFYFPHVLPDGTRKTKNVCVAFNMAEERDLYELLAPISTTELKRRIAIFSYNHLLRAAEKEKRRVTELIKLRLSERGRKRGQFVQVEPSKVSLWLKEIRKAKSNSRLEELEAFLEQFRDKNEREQEEGTYA